jgi:hypothetical protein
MTRFRWTLLPLKRRVGEWQDDIHAAWEDALTAGLAHREDYEGAPICLDALVEIEEDRGR